jgi:hypothetical protein
VALVVAAFVQAALGAHGPFGSRLLRTTGALSMVGLGMLTTLGAFWAVYAAMGRGRLLLKTAYESVALAAAGVWSSFAFPITKASLLEVKGLFDAFWHGIPGDPRYHDALVLFALPVLVYLVTMAALGATVVRGRWDTRATHMLALLIAGVVSFRLAMAAPDVYHLLSSAVPATILLTMLVADAFAFRVRIARWRAPLGALVGFVVALLAVGVAERTSGLHAKMRDVHAGLEVPRDAVHDNLRIHRAGDVLVTTTTASVVDYVEQHSQRTDPIFVRVGMFLGSDIYFLADRRNPTRFDTLSEVISGERQREVLEVLKHDPPELVLGSDTTFIGPDASAYIEQNWKTIGYVGGVLVKKRIVPSVLSP